MHQQRRAIITGGSSGIGRCIAVTLARDGCDVGILHLGRPEEGDEVVRQIEMLSEGRRRAWACVCDVADAEAVHGAFEAFIRQFGGLEVLVNGAGIFRDGVVWKMSDDQWRKVLDVNLTGAFNCAREAARAFHEAGASGGASAGAIVNITSINGMRGKFGQCNYAAAKAGLIGLTKSLARELAKFNVTVNAVAPGLVETPAIAGLPAEARQQAEREILLGRLGRPEDVAETVAFLCGGKARFITGEVIRVDGGQYL